MYRRMLWLILIAAVTAAIVSGDPADFRGCVTGAILGFTIVGVKRLYQKLKASHEE